MTVSPASQHLKVKSSYGRTDAEAQPYLRRDDPR